ncbi:hypothetical protein EYF80_027567 [Liparis tanakae]|uniref:Uncharacterized protein n=1 Tax=Liparis tanakae TaxID=230148 RepID=A0A4Z2H8E8_9TELE|nr:hypothetical protein EYF80_027567 [Liparis tanakae]
MSAAGERSDTGHLRCGVKMMSLFLQPRSSSDSCLEKAWAHGASRLRSMGRMKNGRLSDSRELSMLLFVSENLCVTLEPRQAELSFCSSSQLNRSR